MSANISLVIFSRSHVYVPGINGLLNAAPASGFSHKRHPAVNKTHTDTLHLTATALSIPKIFTIDIHINVKKL